MVIRSKWTVRVESLKINLRVGVHPHERKPQPVIVSLRITGLAEIAPTSLEQCVDYEPACRWLLEDFSKSPHASLIETRINEIAHYLFSNDKRVMEVWVGLYKEKALPNSGHVGMEREMTRRQFDDAIRSLDFRQPITMSRTLAKKVRTVASKQTVK